MRVRAAELEPAVRAATVVVLDIVPKDCLQVASDDQDPIKALGLDRLHPALCEGVGARCLDRGANDVDAFSSKDAIEATPVFGVAVVDEESHGRASILEARREVACLLASVPGSVVSAASPPPTAASRSPQPPTCPVEQPSGAPDANSRCTVNFLQGSETSSSRCSR
jgi:hypothetical protein